MDQISVSAKNLELAIIKAAGELRISPADVSHKVNSQSSGFFGFGKKITIEAWDGSLVKKRAHSTQSAKSKATAKKPYKKTAHQNHKSNKQKKYVNNSKQKRLEFKNKIDSFDFNSEKTQKVIQDLSEFFALILKNGFNIGSEIVTKIDKSNNYGPRLILDVQSNQFAELLTSNDQLAEALEHVLRKKPKHLKKQLPVKIFVDGCGNRASKESELSKLAKITSDKVYNTNQSISLNYKSAYDRKIIHRVLGNDPRVKTRSVGKGAQRKLIVTPAAKDS